MNFPHPRIGEIQPNWLGAKHDSQTALLATAITRQALSPTARSFANGTFSSKDLGTALEQRIALFAARTPRDFTNKNIVIGHFRPDLVGND
ncbi:MAG: hypothetical protein U5J78_01655 [Parasphingorhabdus sp.]|nr:hypothetical protein [Parasphingorhabdus sp.]